MQKYSRLRVCSKANEAQCTIAQYILPNSLPPGQRVYRSKNAAYEDIVFLMANMIYKIIATALHGDLYTKGMLAIAVEIVLAS
jgi:hypothetical protein